MFAVAGCSRPVSNEEWCGRVDTAGRAVIEGHTSQLRTVDVEEEWREEVAELLELSPPEAIADDWATMHGDQFSVGDPQYVEAARRVADFLAGNCPDVSPQVVDLYRGILTPLPQDVMSGGSGLPV